MTELDINAPDTELILAREIAAHARNPVFMCIGTEKVFSDSLGPLVGSLLNSKMVSPLFVYGLCNQNITAENLVYCHQFVRQMHPNNQIVVVDAAVGNHSQIGKIQICAGGIVPGAATNKNLPSVGDVSIVGIVADRGMADFYTLNSQRQRLVNSVAQCIARGILLATSMAKLA